MKQRGKIVRMYLIKKNFLLPWISDNIIWCRLQVYGNDSAKEMKFGLFDGGDDGEHTVLLRQQAFK